MNENKENLSTLQKLGLETYELWENVGRLSEFGEVNEVFVEAMKAQIRLIYKSAVAKICGIDEELVTDEYIDIAMETLPDGGYDPETRTNWDGFRFLTDEELVFRLKPLIDRDMAKRKAFEDILRDSSSEGIEYDEIIVDEPLDETLVVEEPVEQTPAEDPVTAAYPEEGREGSIMGNLHEKLNVIIERYNAGGLSEEEKQTLVDQYNTLARTTIAGIMGVEPEEVPDLLISSILLGKTVETIEDGKLMMYKVPYSDEEVKLMVGLIHYYDKESMEDMVHEYEDLIKKGQETNTDEFTGSK